MTEKLAQYIKDHGIDASANVDGSIATFDEYVTPDGAFHTQPIKLSADWTTVRNWLGY